MEDFAFIGALVSLAWGLVVLRFGGLMGACAAILLTGTCFGAYFFSVPVPPIPLTIDRLLLVVLVAQYVICWAMGWTLNKPVTHSDLATLCFLFVLTASTLTHDWAIQNAMPLSRLVFFYMMPLAMYWVARQIVQTERATYMLFGGMAVFGLYLAATAIAETHEMAFLVFPAYITSPKFPEFLGRGRGPFLNPAACGLVQAVCLSAAWMFWPRLSRLSKCALIPFTLMMFIGVYCTYTRSAWMGLGLSMFVILAALLPRTWRMPFFGGAVIATSLVVATQWESLLAFKRDKALSAQETQDSALLRPMLAQIALNMFIDRPLVGFGFGQYMQHNVDYVNDRTTELPLAKAKPYVQHNVWLGLLTETGLIGVTTFCVMLWFWLHNAWHVWRTQSAPPYARYQALLFLATFAAYLPNALFQDISITSMVNMLLFFLAGLVEGLKYQIHSIKQPKIERPSYASGFRAALT